MYEDDQNASASFEDDEVVGAPDQEGLNTNSDSLYDEESHDQPHTTPGAEAKPHTRKERAEAIREAERQKSLAKAARTEAQYFKQENQVLREVQQTGSTTSLHDIYATDPEMGDQIAKKLWGKSYNQLLNEAEGGTSNAAPDLDSAIERALSKKQHAEESNKIQDRRIDFLVSHDLDQNSLTFKKIWKDFDEFAPKSLSQANRVLEMLYLQYTGKKVSKENRDVDDVPSMSTRRTGQLGSDPIKTNNPELRKFIIQRYGEKTAKEYFAKKPQ